MTIVSLPLPESLESFVAAQVAAEGHDSASDYILDLLRQAQLTKLRAEREAKLLAGVDSLERGEGREMTAADWDRLRAYVRQCHAAPEQP